MDSGQYGRIDALCGSFWNGGGGDVGLQVHWRFGDGGIQVVSGGISEALISTAAGIFVALEAVVLFNILQNLASSLARNLALSVDEMLELAEVRRKDAERSGK